jgi:phosphate transport system substrate-binding protein
VLAAGALALGAAACGSEDEPAGTGGAAPTETPAEPAGTDFSKLSGSIRIDGSSTVEPLANAAAELIQEQGAQLMATVGGAGTGDGFEKFCRGELDISDASRGIEADEFAACKKEGITPVEVQVGIDGLSVIVNPALEFPENCIKVTDLKKLLAPGSKVKNYSELGPGYPDAPVSFFTPGTESGTYDYFTEAVLETDAEQRTGKEVQTSADDNQIVTGISGTEGALGYVGFAFADQNKDKLKTLAVDNGDGCVTPDTETIANNSYAPLSRPLFMYPSTETIKKPEVKGFLEFINENNAEITKASDYIALTEELKTKAKANIDGATPAAEPAE